MIIIDNMTKRTVRLRELNDGDVFEYDNKVYIRTAMRGFSELDWIEEDTIICIDLSNGNADKIAPAILVHPISAELILKDWSENNG